MIDIQPEPTQGPDEPWQTFIERHAVWWRGADVALRTASHDRQEAALAAIDSAIEPTLQAWTALDVRLGELATAMTSGDGVSEPTLLEAMRISRGAPGG